MYIYCLRAGPRIWKHRFILVSQRQEYRPVLEQPLRAGMENSVEAASLANHEVSIYRTFNDRRERKKIKGQIKKN